MKIYDSKQTQPLEINIMKTTNVVARHMWRFPKFFIFYNFFNEFDKNYASMHRWNHLQSYANTF